MGVEDVIKQAYEETLGREADPSGLKSYKDQHNKSWTTLEDLTNILKGSGEYQEKIKTKTKLDTLNQKVQVPWELKRTYKHPRNLDAIPITVVITNWKRLEFLKPCVESILRSGIPNIVVSCCETSPETLTWLDTQPDSIKVTHIEGDLGCNRLWLNGLYHVQTPYVLVMHDDDELSVDFKDSLVDICNILAEKPSMVWWDGIIKEDGKVTNEYHANFSGKEGWVESKTFLNEYIGGLYPMSPVVQIMNTQSCIRALNECDTHFTDSKYFSKPAMMLGNEITMTCRSLLTADKCYYFNRGLTYFGRHPGSESEIYMQNGQDDLKRGYKAARDYLKASLYKPLKSEGSIVHVVNPFLPRDPDDIRRHVYACNNWKREYERGHMIPLHIADSEFRRDSSHVGDKKKMPFINDILDISSHNIQDHDIIVLTNADISFATDAHVKIREAVSRHGCCFSFRYDAYEPLEQAQYTSEEVQDHLQWYVGSDMFAMTKAWWLKWKTIIPLLLIGKPNWDWIFRVTMGYSIEGGRVFDKSLESAGDVCEVKGVIYHEKHDSFAEQASVYFRDPANVWNWRAAMDFFSFMAAGKRVDGTEIFDNVKPYMCNLSPWYSNQLKK